MPPIPRHNAQESGDRAALLSPVGTSPTGVDEVFVLNNDVITLNLNRPPDRKKRLKGFSTPKAVIRVSCLVFREKPLVAACGCCSLHFSPPDGRSTRYEHQDFVALACRAQRTVQVRLRAPSGSRLVLTALSCTSPRHVVRKAGYLETPAVRWTFLSFASRIRPRGT